VIKTVSSRFLNLSPLARFLLKAGTVYVGWQFIYTFILLPDGRLDTVLSYAGVKLAAGLLSLLGWTVESMGRFVGLPGSSGVEIQNGCNGLELIGLFCGFIVAYPGPSNRMALFLFGGVFLLFAANVLRIAVFALWTHYFPQSWEPMHIYSSYVFFYPVVLPLWYLWTVVSDRPGPLSGGGLSSA